MPQDAYFFLSYAYQDWERIYPIVEILRQSGIQLWIDRERLQTGDDWERAVKDAIESSLGIITFVTENYAESPSAFWEAGIAVGSSQAIIPVILENAVMPPTFTEFQYVDLTHNYENGIFRLVHDLRQWQEQSKPLKDSKIDLKNVTSSFITKPVVVPKPLASSFTPPESVFLVHGHDRAFLETVKQFLYSIGVRPIVLSDEANEHLTLFEKFFTTSSDVNFAVILISSDDYGCAVREYNETYENELVRDRALNYRARQNVILEMGFFYGRLGTNSVCVLVKPSPRHFPRFERPSDMEGILFETLDSSGTWKIRLKDALQKAGFVLD